MQENLKLFDKIPYEVRIIKGSFLSVAQAEEAINDVLSDTSAFFKTPTLSEILKVRSDNVYGVFKLILTVDQGTQYPEYMLNARVAELEPKLVNIIFETAEIEETEEFAPLQNIDISQPIEHAKGQGLNIIAQASTQLGVTYKELAEL
ncbi:MAG: hypothetical protein U9N39_02145, partial [Campylobacterota bacterium]|nr:hypothetical protein [Campylobacterota bacterium]